MKIVQINAVNRYSSTGTNTQELHRFLIDNNHESYVFCTNECTPSENIFRIGNPIDYKFHAILSRITGLQGYYSYFSTKKLINQLEFIKPDVILLGNLHNNYINLKLLLEYISKCNITTVNVLHDCWSFTGHCCHYTKIGCLKWQNSCYSCPLLKEDNISYVDRTKKIFKDKMALFHRVKKLGIVGVSEWIMTEAMKSPMFTNAKFMAIYNWIDLDVFSPQDKNEVRNRLGLNKYKFYAISVSQEWIPEKGFNTIINLAKKRSDIAFILVGRPPQLQSIPDNLLFTGALSDKTVLRDYYSASDVYLNLSVQETFGKVSAEALACGLPVIAGNTTASPEVIGNCGIVVDLHNEESILNALDNIANKSIVFTSDSCRCHAVLNFDKNTNLRKYLSFFESFQSQA